MVNVSWCYIVSFEGYHSYAERISAVHNSGNSGMQIQAVLFYHHLAAKVEEKRD